MADETEDRIGKHDVEDPKRGDRIEDECDCCGYGTALIYTPDDDRQKPGRWLCEVCRSTFLSYAVLYPSPHRDGNLYRSIGWVANRILDEIRKGHGPS